MSSRLSRSKKWYSRTHKLLSRTLSRKAIQSALQRALSGVANSISLRTTLSIALLTLVSGVGVLSAATTWPGSPSRVPDGGWFKTYFTNISTACPAGQIRSGYTTIAGNDFLKPICSGSLTLNGNVSIGGNVSAPNLVSWDNATKTTNITNPNSPLSSGFYNTETSTGTPYYSWWHIMTNRHSNTGNQFEFQIASDFWQGGANSYIRTIEDGSAKAWRKLVTENASGNVSIGGSINTSGSITSAGPISVNTETWGLLLRDAAWTDNAVKKSGVGSLYANDVYIRSAGKWASEMGGSTIFKSFASQAWVYVSNSNSHSDTTIRYHPWYIGGYSVDLGAPKLVRLYAHSCEASDWPNGQSFLFGPGKTYPFDQLTKLWDSNQNTLHITVSSNGTIRNITDDGSPGGGGCQISTRAYWEDPSAATIADDIVIDLTPPPTESSTAMPTLY